MIRQAIEELVEKVMEQVCHKGARREGNDQAEHRGARGVGNDQAGHGGARGEGNDQAGHLYQCTYVLVEYLS